jgi:hypothetical protein
MSVKGLVRIIVHFKRMLSICLEGLEENHVTGQELNFGPCEYKARVFVMHL